MMNIRNGIALSAVVALVAVGQSGLAQDDLDNLLKDLEAEATTPAAKTEAKVEVEAEEPKVEAEEAKVEEPKAEAPKPAATVAATDAELLENLRTTEKLRRGSLDAQAMREIAEARECMANAEYSDAVRHYGLALKLLNDRAGSKQFKKECDQGIAEGLFRAALQEEELGRRERAVQLMEKAIGMRHPKARRVLEKWVAEGNETEVKADGAEYAHRINEQDFKNEREQIRKHLRRSRQYLAVRDMAKALEEAEIVLVNDPYNQDALRIRRAIERKRQTILKQEREAARDGMIADVDEAWRPVYAVNAARLNESSAETVKTQTGDDPERTQEQDIVRRMKEMRLPTISFKPPATIIEAVEFFRTASKDYDRPDIPIEKRGFNFVLRTPQGAIKTQQAEESSDDFSSGDEGAAAPSNGLEPIQTITASDITFYEALKLVCDSVGYKFIVRGPVVMVMPVDMSTAELLSRKYNVPEAFVERLNSASSEMKEMGGFGSSNRSKNNNEEETESEDRDWKGFFTELGVQWPEGSSIKHIKSLGKLYVRNTRENLAEFEKVIEELGGQTMLIEIETRFVEVSQEDLNSLGFEWILNSDYSLDLGGKLNRALGLKSGEFSPSKSTRSETVNTDVNTETIQSEAYGQANPPLAKYEEKTTRTVTTKTVIGDGSTWVRRDGADGSVGVNAFGGNSQYGSGSRYLSTTGNFISGESKSTNDQFMRVNAFLGSADLSMILHMLSQRSDTDLLSAPKVVTKSGENAVIKVVTEYIYPQDYDVQLQSSSSSGGGGSSSGGSSSAILAVVEPQNFTMREVGVVLDVTPTYSEANGGTIDLEMKPSVVQLDSWKNYGMKIPFTGNPSTGVVPDPGTLFNWIPGAAETLADAVNKLIGAQSEAVATAYMDSALKSMNPSTIEYYDAPMEQPFFAARSIDSKVSITPGSTVVMGGLITEQRKAMDDKVPFLGDLPFIGRLFRSHAEQTIKRNLLIFVTGRLITPSGRELRVNDGAASEAEVKEAPKAE